MAEYNFKKLSSVETENEFSSQTSNYFIVEDGGSIKRLNADSLISNQAFVATFSGQTENDDASCDKTWEEIKEAFNTSKSIYFRYIDVNTFFNLSVFSYTIQNEELKNIGLSYIDIQELAVINNGYTHIRIFMDNTHLTIDYEEI